MSTSDPIGTADPMGTADPISAAEPRNPMSDDAHVSDVSSAQPVTDDSDDGSAYDAAEIEALEFGVGLPAEDSDRSDTDRTGDDRTDAGRAAVRPNAGANRTRPAQGRGPRRRSRAFRLRRRLASALVLMIGLAAMGGLFSMFAQSSTAQSTSSDDVAAGRQLFSRSCITCHGANLQGVTSRGPSLIGVGGAAAYFQVGTGRMPLVGQGPDAPRKESIYTEAQVLQLAAYVQSVGGGTPIPVGNLRDDAHLAEGGELFRLNCASCHNYAGKGAPLSAGKYAPSLNKATDLEIATAMLTGPENMPVFNNNQLTPTQKREIISYIQTIKATPDPGGSGLDRVGPVTEGLAIWIIGIGATLLIILWIGAKS
jgi:ubiquinol-cytochrome c reductase cytochrome c subunit